MFTPVSGGVGAERDAQGLATFRLVHFSVGATSKRALLYVQTGEERPVVVQQPVVVAPPHPVYVVPPPQVVYVPPPRPVYYAPPPPPRYYAPPVQRVWVPGYWTWHHGRQVWVDGRWVKERPVPAFGPGWSPGWG